MLGPLSELVLERRLETFFFGEEDAESE